MTHSASRIDGIDIARGLSMLLVVIMHSTIGVEAATGRNCAFQMLVDFAQGFRIPAFFLISGLFLAKAMRFSLEEVFRRRVFGLMVLYLLWLIIHVSIRSIEPVLADPMHGLFGKDGWFQALALGLIDPFGALWFIYLLAVFVLAGWFLRAVPGWITLAFAMLLETLRVQTGWTLIDEFCARFVYFQLGLMLAPFLLPKQQETSASHLPAFSIVQDTPALSIALLLVWGIGQSLLVAGGYDRWRIISLLDGIVGAGALLLIGALLARLAPRGALTRFLMLMGRRSIVVYLVFTIPMALMRMAILRVFPDLHVDLIILLVVFTAITVSLAVERVSHRSRRMGRLFERPFL